MKRKYSIVIPCFNCLNSIETTLKSCLMQTSKCFEIIIIDDCNEFNLKEKLSHYNDLAKKSGVKLTIYRNIENLGVSRSRNIGWNLSQGQYILFLDADDFWHKDKILLIDLAIEINNEIDFICHSYTQPNKDYNYNNFFNSSIGRWEVKKLKKIDILKKNPSQTSCFALKSTIEDRFNERMSYSEDYDLWIRISNKTPLYFLQSNPLTMLSRPEQTPGGLSEKRIKMRLGEIFAYWNFSKRYYFMTFPLLLFYSLIKHLRSEVKYARNKKNRYNAG